ncbi:MAG: GNAT family N-acetyltransferase [Spirochaetota bacterium]
MPIKIRQALSEEDKDRVFRFRYKAYVEDLGRKQHYADHKKKTVKEPFDANAILFMAEDNGEVVGTIRTNIKSQGPIEFEELYELENFEPYYPDKVSITTKFMVSKDYRKSYVAAMLSTTVYVLLREMAIEFDFITCEPHLVRLYQQMGYRFYKGSIQRQNYRDSIPLVLLTSDTNYFQMIKSPFLRYARKFQNSSNTWLFFRRVFREYAYLRPNFALGEEQLWSNFGDLLQERPGSTPVFLEGFSLEERKLLIAKMEILHYSPNSFIVKKGDDGLGMFCVLKGQVEAIEITAEGEFVTDLIYKHETFGELGFISSTPHKRTYRARNNTKILVLNKTEFQRLEKAFPQLALKLLKNVTILMIKRYTQKSEALAAARSTFTSLSEQMQNINHILSHFDSHINTHLE